MPRGLRRAQAACVALGLALAAAACGGGGGGDEPGSDSLLDGDAVNVEAAEQLLAEFDALDDGAQEQQAAEVDRKLERATWVVSGLEEAVGGPEQADAIFESANAGIRTKLAREAARLTGADAFGRTVPLRTDELSEAQGASLFGALMISSLSADLAAGLVDGKHTGSQTEKGVTRTATEDTGSVTVEVTKTIDGVEVTIRTSATIAPCPDPDGRVHAEGSMQASASKGGVGHEFTYEAKVDIQVGDDAEISSTTEELHAEQGNVSGGKETYVAVSVGAGGDYTVDSSRGDLPPGYAEQSANGALVMGRLLSHRLARAAEDTWKSGKCVTLEPTVSDGPSGLEPGSSVTITAAPRSKIDGGPTGGTVVARLVAGGAGVSPEGSKVKADATFVYTAPPEKEKTADVELEARSRRGVAKASLHFDTYELSFVASGGGGEFRGEGRICDLRKPFTISGTGLTLDFTPDGPTGGTYDLSGNAAGVVWSGGGTYAVNLNGSQNAGNITTQGINTITTPRGVFSDRATATFELRMVHACG